MSLTTQRGSRSTQKQMPPRYWAQVLDRQPQPPRAGRAEHQPVRALREELVRQRVAEHLVVDPEVVDDDAALGNAGGAAGLEDVDRLVRAAPSAPSGAPARRAAIRPRRRPNFLQVVEALDVLERVELERLGLLQPERRAGLRAEVPAGRSRAPGRRASRWACLDLVRGGGRRATVILEIDVTTSQLATRERGRQSTRPLDASGSA